MENLAFLFLIGCVQLIPSVTKTGENTYYLKTNGSSLASPNTLISKMDEKQSICVKVKAMKS